MNQKPVSLGDAGKQIELLKARVRALEILIAKALSTIPPHQRAGLFEEAKQTLLIDPNAAEIQQQIESIRRLSN
ncbi:hypothetical protein [Xanthomonas citri]|uniref:hypothetical protein n=1 Tax=Xanthomonas citri TaxID=346 RepID=UPI001CBD5E37|nr:hypothetical protein [Xanthomonas citri]MBZ3928228.1 hypothetical protein [Xanthomonas citri pv. thirumalacharii]